MHYILKLSPCYKTEMLKCTYTHNHMLALYVKKEIRILLNHYQRTAINFMFIILLCWQQQISM